MGWISEEVRREVAARDRLVKPLAERVDELEAENSGLRERVAELELAEAERAIEKLEVVVGP